MAQPSASNAPRIANASAPVDRRVLGAALRETPTTVVGVPGVGVVVGFVVAGAVAVGVVATGGAVVAGVLVVGVADVGVAPGATVPGWAPFAGAVVAVGPVVPPTLADAGTDMPNSDFP
jgi:hypothetical protein